PGKTGSLNCQSRMPRIARVRIGGACSPNPLATAKIKKPWAMGRRKGGERADSWSRGMGVKAPLSPAELTVCAHVTVRPSDRPGPRSAPPLLADLDVVEVQVVARVRHGPAPGASPRRG